MVLLSEFMQNLGMSFGAFFEAIGPGLVTFLIAMTAVVGALCLLAFLEWFFKMIQEG